jgi:TRAP-type mannitol/chloroaromatic compound transport system substrate-binding protein
MRLASLVVHVLILLASLPASAQQSSGEPQRVRLRMQTAFNPGLSVLGEGARHFANAVKATSNGALTLKIVEAGGRVPSANLLDAVVGGELDAAFTWSGHAATKLSALNLFASVPFGPSVEEYVGWMVDGGGRALHRELYDRLGVHAMMCGIMGPEAGGWFRSEIGSVADLKGLRLRFTGLAGEVLQRFGAEVVNVASGDVFNKLQSGMLDGAEFSMPSVDRALGLEKLGMLYYFPGWHQPASLIDFYMRKDRWEALSREQRAQIEMACQSTVLFTMARAPAEQARALAYFRKQGISLRFWAPSTLESFRETSADVMREHAEKDADFRRVWEHMRQYLDGPRAWQRLSRP